MNNYRLYSFVNHMYMSEKQFGIQTAHCVAELSQARGAWPARVFADWAINDKTIIMCQGGNVKALLMLELELRMLAGELRFPLAAFREDQDSLGGVITAVAVIVPERLWDVKIALTAFDTALYTRPGEEYTVPEQSLMQIIKQARLA